MSSFFLLTFYVISLNVLFLKLLVLFLKFLVTTDEKKVKIPICEQIGKYKVHIMQNDGGCVVGVAVSLCLLEKISHAEKLVQFYIIAIHVIKLMPETGIDEYAVEEI